MLTNANRWFKMANEEANMGEDWNQETPSQPSGFFGGTARSVHTRVPSSLRSMTLKFTRITLIEKALVVQGNEEANMGRAGALKSPSRLSSFFGELSRQFTPKRGCGASLCSICEMRSISHK